MADDSQRPIIVKRIKKGGHGHHGGAWKIAYADFVTAMMAFFLLMWLLGSTAKGDLKGIADHFNQPLKVAMFGGSGAGDATSVIQGGGQDLSRSAGQVSLGETRKRTKSDLNPKALKEQAEAEKKEQQALLDLKGQIEKMIENNPAIKQFKNQLLIDITPEGLRIQIVDEQNRPMFDTSSADIKTYTRDILREIGKLLNGVPNRVTLSGHTDAAQFATGEKGFSNWELSANRANSARRELVAGGMDELKVLRVTGLASTIMFDRNDPLNPSNRRISIIVMNKKAERSVLLDHSEGADIELSSQETNLQVDKLTPKPPAALGPQ
jgi:chemotaxis protein MotB